MPDDGFVSHDRLREWFGTEVRKVLERGDREANGRAFRDLTFRCVRAGNGWSVQVDTRLAEEGD